MPEPSVLSVKGLYTEYVDERIIGPLGLSRTTWRSVGSSSTSPT